MKIKKFDDVRIKSKNLIGVVYQIDKTLGAAIVKTAKGNVTSDINNLELIYTENVIYDYKNEYVLFSLDQSGKIDKRHTPETFEKSRKGLSQAYRISSSMRNWAIYHFDSDGKKDLVDSSMPIKEMKVSDIKEGSGSIYIGTRSSRPTNPQVGPAVGYIGGIKSFRSPADEMTLFKADDVNLIFSDPAVYRTKPEEKIYRYSTPTVGIAKMLPLVKINILTTRVYFLTDDGESFSKQGVPFRYLTYFSGQDFTKDFPQSVITKSNLTIRESNIKMNSTNISETKVSAIPKKMLGKIKNMADEIGVDFKTDRDIITYIKNDSIAQDMLRYAGLDYKKLKEDIDLDEALINESERADRDIETMITNIKRGAGWIDPEYVEDTWDGFSTDRTKFKDVKIQIFTSLIDADLLYYSDKFPGQLWSAGRGRKVRKLSDLPRKLLEQNQIVEKTFTGEEIADKMRKNPKAFLPFTAISHDCHNCGRHLIDRVARMKTVTAKQLVDMLTDYVAGGDIQQLFKENQIVEKTFTGKEIADKMRKEPEAFGGRNLINRIAQMKTVTPKELDDMLPDYVAGGDIQQLFKENQIVESKRDINESTKSLFDSIANKDYNSAKKHLEAALENKKKIAIQNKIISEKTIVNSIDQLKKDQYVKVDKGPHKNEWHLIIHVDKNRGTANVVPVEVKPKDSKYRHGAVAIRPENVVELSNTKPSFVMKNLPPARYQFSGR